MPARKTRRLPDFNAEFAKLIDANQRAYAWAEKAIAYRQAGKVKQAKEAERKAKHWLRKVMEVETKAGKGYDSRPQRH